MRRLIPIILIILSPLTQACSLSDSESPERETVTDEAFIQAYFELRMRALKESSDAELSISVRDSILDGLGLTDQDLLTFVDVWGEDGERMNDVWQVVDSLIRVERVAASDDDYEEGGVTEGEANQRAQREREGGGRP